jgi:Ca2+/H+ antiporter, TMEM165/GDT1 family
MDLAIVVSTFVLVFAAELGDKTQLVAVTLSQRYAVLPAIAGVWLAFLVLNVLAVLVGQTLYRHVPQQAALLATGAVFLVFAYRSWREAANGDDEDHGIDHAGGRSALYSSFILIFLAEFGDKTQLALIALATKTGDSRSVLAGGTLALWAGSLLAIMLGRTVLRRLPRSWMHRIAAALFLAFGLLAFEQTLFRGA